MSRDGIEIHPATPDRWPDVETVMGPRGGAEGCWCMVWRHSARDYAAGRGADNRDAMRRLIEAGEVPGLLAYDGETPVGWCSVAPRGDFPRLANSRVLAPVDDRPVWSVSCFVIARNHRGRGLTRLLLEAAVSFVRERGGVVLEGYPIAPTKDRYPAAYAWTGFQSAFTEAGFREVARRSPTRPIMRLDLIP